MVLAGGAAGDGTATTAAVPATAPTNRRRLQRPFTGPSSAIALEVMPDHVLLFVKHDAKSSASYVANQFKGFTFRVLRDEFPHLKSRMPILWSSSYIPAWVGAVSAATVAKDINTQR
ncbi:transposase [Streptomyces sp. NPDC051917]|uniref:transposase n=1 Tax=Streptomyces sp. NPDC051917 TaxID=3154754 RepID=UPI00344FF949